jgi:hypothetical protein
VGYIAGGTETMQFWCKRAPGHNGTSNARFRYYDGVAGYNVDFLPSETWELKTFSRAMNAASTRVSCNIYPDIGTDQNGILVWHPQVQEGGSATPYKANGATAGGIVDQWDDSSGNNNHIAQATQAYQPLVRGASLDGHSSAVLDGVDDYMSLTTEQTFAGAHEVWWVSERNGIDLTEMMWSGFDNSLEYLIINVDESLTVGNDGPIRVSSTGAFLADGPYLVRFQRDGSDDLYAWKDGVTVTDGPLSDAGNMSYFNLGCRSNFSGFVDGPVWEQVIINGNLTAAEATAMLGYFARQYPSLGI